MVGLVTIMVCEHGIAKSAETTHQGNTLKETASTRPLFRSYPVSAAFQFHGPRLTREQRDWIAKIVHSRNYGWERSKLRFAVVSDRIPPFAHGVPIVVYRAHMYQGIDHGGLIIGESCSSFFDPYQFGFVTTPGDVSCNENSKPVK